MSISFPGEELSSREEEVEEEKNISLPGSL